MKLIRLIILTIPALIMTGCAAGSLPVVTDYDRDAEFHDYRTYYWSDDFHLENGIKEDAIFYNTLNQKRLKKAIQSEMAGRGYILDNENPDLLINAKIVVQQISTSQNRYLGYPYFYSYYPNNYSIVTTEQQEGGIVVELIDNKRCQLVWQGFAPNILEATTEDKERQIRDAVSMIFAKYEYRADQLPS